MTEKLTNRTDEKGSALVLAVFVLALLGTMGVALLFLSQSEVKMSQASLRGKKAFFLAEAGLEAGRAQLLASNTVAGALADDLATAAGPNGVIDFSPDTLQVVYDDAGNVTGFTGYGDDVPLYAATDLGEGVFAAFLNNDAVDGTASTSDTNDRITVTGVGTGENRSLEIVQAIVEPEPLLPTLPPAAVVLLMESTGTATYADGGSGGSGASGS